MTRDQIIKAAVDAGFEVMTNSISQEMWMGSTSADCFIRFATRIEQLARADERDQCAQIIEGNIEQCYPDGSLYEVLLSNTVAIRARKD